MYNLFKRNSKINDKKILIFDDQLSGHHLEYFHHLYTGAVQDKTNNYIFALPEGFETKSELRWDKANNIVFHLFKDQPFSTNKIKRSFELSKFVKKIAQQYCVDEVFFVSLMSVLPAISFILPRSIKISGIIYLIYLYRWKESNLKLKIEDSIKYLLMSNGKQFKTVFLLNDEIAPIYLNKKFKTNKFIYLPDPYISLPSEKICNLRKELNIPEENKILLHFGAIAKRKGSLNIVKAIDQCHERDLEKLSFIFAGRIDNDIKLEFYRIIGKVKDKVQIIMYDEFCSYEFLASLCRLSDFLLIPYLTTSQSSGVIGYASQFNKPVVVPRKGLIGKLVKKYKLGILLTDSSPAAIRSFICNINQYESMKIDNNYIKDRTIVRFNDIIFSRFYV